MGKLPDNAKRVFEGVIFDVYQWEQEMFDGSTQTFEAIKRCSTVGVIAVTKDKKIIMQKEEQPFVGKFTNLPAGQMDEGESPLETAKRELLEESGYESGDFSEFYRFPLTSKLVWESTLFIAKNCRKVTGQKLDVGEKIETYLVTFEEFLDEVENDSFRDYFFRQLLFRIRHTPGELEKFKKLLFD